MLTGGYNAEWGRAIGGIVNIVTQDAAPNQLRGSVFGTVSPGFLTAARETAPIERVVDRCHRRPRVLGGLRRRARRPDHQGPAVVLRRPRAAASIAPTYTRTTKRQTDCRRLLPTGELSGCDARLTSLGGHADGEPDVDPRTGFFITDELDREVRCSHDAPAVRRSASSTSPSRRSTRRSWSLIAVPARTRSPGADRPALVGRPRQHADLDTAARWTSKLDDGRTEVEALVAWHHSTLDTGAIDASLDGVPRQLLFGGDLGTWSALGGESRATIAGLHRRRRRRSVPAITNCPMDALGYAIGGPGAIARDREDRLAARLGRHPARPARRHARAQGRPRLRGQPQGRRAAVLRRRIHPELRRPADRRHALGPARRRQASSIRASTRRAHTPDPDGTTGDGEDVPRATSSAGPPARRARVIAGQTLNWAAYLRDSWQPRSNLTLNAGLRYEEQRLQLRVEPARHGRSADRQPDRQDRDGPARQPRAAARRDLGSDRGRPLEGLRARGAGSSRRSRWTSTIARSAARSASARPSRRRRSSGRAARRSEARRSRTASAASTPDAAPSSEQLIGSSGVLVAPGIKAQYMDELLLGAEYQLAERSEARPGLPATASSAA